MGLQLRVRALHSSIAVEICWHGPIQKNPPPPNPASIFSTPASICNYLSNPPHIKGKAVSFLVFATGSLVLNSLVPVMFQSTLHSFRLTLRSRRLFIYRPFATTVSQLKMCDSSGENFKAFAVLQFSMSATTTQLLASGEFCKLRYDTIPVKSASANVSFYTNNSKMLNFKLWHSCLKWGISFWL